MWRFLGFDTSMVLPTFCSVMYFKGLLKPFSIEIKYSLQSYLEVYNTTIHSPLSPSKFKWACLLCWECLLCSHHHHHHLNFSSSSLFLPYHQKMKVYSSPLSKNGCPPPPCLKMFVPHMCVCEMCIKVLNMDTHTAPYIYRLFISMILHHVLDTIMHSKSDSVKR